MHASTNGILDSHRWNVDCNSFRHKKFRWTRVWLFQEKVNQCDITLTGENTTWIYKPSTV